MAYIVPQVLIRQLLENVSANTVQNQNVLVIGPRYELFRHADADEWTMTGIGRYDSSAVIGEESNENPNRVFDTAGESVDTISVTVDGTVHPEVFPYPEVIDGGRVDPSYTKVFADDAVIALTKADALGTTWSIVESVVGSDSYSVVTFDENVVKSEGHATRINVLERDIAAGDAISIDLGGNHFDSKIVEVKAGDRGGLDTVVLEKRVPKDILDSLEHNTDNRAYTGTTGLRFCAVADGVEIPATAGTTVNWKTVDDFVNDKNGVEIKAATESVNPMILVPYGNWGDDEYYELVSGQLHFEYRVLNTNAAKTIEALENHVYASRDIGANDPDNPLSFGAYMAALNSGDRVVYYLGVETDDLEGYNKALGIASNTDDVYFIVPLTTDKTIIEAVKTHVHDMSSETGKMWRVGFVAEPVPDTAEIYGPTSHPTGEYYYVSIESKEYNGVVGYYLTFRDSATGTGDSRFVNCHKDLRAGDKIKVNFEDGAEVYTVDKIVDDTCVKLDESTVTVTSGTNPDATAYRVLEKFEIAEAVAGISSRLGDRRMYNVFPGVAANSGTVFGGEFLAAAAAGLASSTLPQQPITNVELNGVDNVASVRTTFSRTDLDKIAEGGTFIVMQDRPNTKVYVRHQLSTGDSGNVLERELSVTRDLDSVSYYIKSRFENFIGRANITPALVTMARSRLLECLRELSSMTSTSDLIGPQIIADGSYIEEIYQDPVQRDKIRAKLRLNLPVPFNYFDLTLVI